MRKISEALHQEALMEWASLDNRIGPYLFHIPNGALRRKMDGARLRRQGVKSGVPDLFFALPCGKFHGLFIELKKDKRSTISIFQKEWISKLNANGYAAIVAYGWEEAREILINYINNRSFYGYKISSNFG